MKETSTRRAFLRLHKGAVVYGLLLVFAIVFTQALRSPASSMLFWFLILYLPVSFLYVYKTSRLMLFSIFYKFHFGRLRNIIHIFVPRKLFSM